MKHNSIFKVRFTVFLLMSLICMKGLGHSPKAVAQGSQDAPLYQLFVWMKNGEKTGYLSTDKPEIRLDGENVKFSTIHTELYILNEDLDKFTLEPVSPEDPTDISVVSELSVEIGQRKQVVYTLTPPDAQTTITWLNSNPEVIYVSESGWITGLKAGTSLLKAQTSNGLRDECLVTVPEPAYVFYVWLKDGRIIGYPVEEEPLVEIGDELLTLTTKNATVGYAYESVLKFTFEDASVDNPVTEIAMPAVAPMQMNFNAEGVSLSGLIPSSQVSIYDMQGVLVATQSADSEGFVYLSTSRYPHGVYIVKTEKSNYKILKK